MVAFRLVQLGWLYTEKADKAIHDTTTTLIATNHHPRFKAGIEGKNVPIRTQSTSRTIKQIPDGSSNMPTIFEAQFQNYANQAQKPLKRQSPEIDKAM